MKKTILLWIAGAILVTAGVSFASYLGDFLRAGINPQEDSITFDYAGITFEGTTADGNETTLLFTDPTSDANITIPNSTGNMILNTSTGVWKHDSTSVNATVIKNLNSSAYELVPAPGSGKVIEFVSAVMILDHRGVDYAANGDLSIQTGTTGTTLSDTVAQADFLQLSADAIRSVQALSADTQLDANEGLVLFCSTGDPTTGNGTLTVNTIYRVHTTGL